MENFKDCVMTPKFWMIVVGLLRQIQVKFHRRFLDTTERRSGTAFFQAVRVHQLIHKSKLSKRLN
jgi:hypothetical protein